jgi:hypothetical protein
MGWPPWCTVSSPVNQNRAEGALGYDGSQQSLSGFARVEIGNLFGTGRKVGATWERFRRDRSKLDLAYREPYILGLPLAAEGALSQEIEDSTWTRDDIRIAAEGEFGGGLSARLGLAAHRTVQSGFVSRRRAVCERSSGSRRSEKKPDARSAIYRRISARTCGAEDPEAERSSGCDVHGESTIRRRWFIRVGSPLLGQDPFPSATGAAGLEKRDARGYPEQNFRVLHTVCSVWNPA